MSQVGVSRPASQMSNTQRLSVILPEIKHPLSRMSNPRDLGVRGVSRSGDRPFSQLHRPDTQGSQRPLPSEHVYTPRKSLSATSRLSVARQSFQKENLTPILHETIPEGVETTHGDPDKARLPLFGNRAEIASRHGESRAASRLSKSSSQARLEIDELEMILKERIRQNFSEVKKRFKDNDPEGKGNVTREALCRIMVMLIARPLPQSLFTRLMDRIGLKDRQVIHYTEFFAIFRDAPDGEYPRWLDPVQRRCQERVSMSAMEVHCNLKERAKQRFLDIADLIPQLNPDGSGHIERAEFRNALNKMNFFMDDDQYQKLWNKYDIDGRGTINGEKLLNLLGINLRNGTASTRKETDSARSSNSNRSLKKKEIERQQSLDIERWIKTKFREGFTTMKASFEAIDHELSGMIRHDSFLEVLSNHGLTLERGLLPSFLARVGVTNHKEGVPYREFLVSFQNRGNNGMAHKVFADPKQSEKLEKPSSPGDGSVMGSIVTQLIAMFQRDFISLLGFFQRLDKFSQGIVSQEEFRATLESRFDLELTESQFESFLDHLPLDEDGNVLYKEFMKQFDTNGVAPSLFAPPAVEPMDVSEEQEDNTRDLLTDAHDVDRLVVEEDPILDNLQRRPTKELFKVLKAFLTKNYHLVEETFNEMDEINTRRLSKEGLYLLLKKCNMQPEISRGEVRDIWKTFITNTDRTLDFLQFVRHFGHSLRSAAFPNSKISPPKRGDADFMMRSRKLNCAADMLQDCLRSKIDYMWEDLRREFVEMDPYGTGFVNEEEFREVLTELCVHLNSYELEMIAKKFSTKHDGRVSYLEFLKPFAMRKDVWRHGNNMMSVLHHPQCELPINEIVEPPQQGLHGITARLRQKLVGDWKNLRRAFRKLDHKNEGYLSVPEFRSVLKLTNVILDEDEVYHVMTQFDEHMSGKIPYEKFINEIFNKPGTSQSVRPQ